MADRGISVGGVLQEAVQEDGESVAYRARRIGDSHVAVPLARRGTPPERAREDAACAFCSFVFDGGAFAEARGWVREATRTCDVVIVDEVSKLEVSRAGHHDAVRDALASRALTLLVVRADQLFAVVERFEFEDAVAALDAADDGALAAFVDAVARAVRGEVRST